MNSAESWRNALAQVSECNSNPSLPVEGILLTMRLGGSSAEKKVEKLLGCMEEDMLCKYLIVLGIDEDEIDTDAARVLIKRLQLRADLKQQMQSLHVITNPSQPSGKPFAVCRAWDSMAVEAWTNMELRGLCCWVMTLRLTAHFITEHSTVASWIFLNVLGFHWALAALFGMTVAFLVSHRFPALAEHTTTFFGLSFLNTAKTVS
jgi:hypothetical protein